MSGERVAICVLDNVCAVKVEQTGLWVMVGRESKGYGTWRWEGIRSTLTRWTKLREGIGVCEEGGG